ncbi:RagB/SusD family nutrient uptake outer membrane protein [Adhaeribacter pallidiroseus]|uniref:SusD-like N-terminal domain-containing protein n=1 Tax=Adhaeribacter pallidiroseus TaxID=2072847 RepID=A0A369QN13_9BACT|nr:RagB/SusD family nutrient uptake outer membrane protein [Adhaeribacter pallidiroseus]RDC65750.1 hypothetical protein AHMF7616_04380 [Adhaeribacter pallidiroseus]
MKNILKYTLLSSLLAFTGCEDYLEQAVDQRTQLNTVEKVSELLVTAYPKADYATFTEAMSDLADDKGVNSITAEDVVINRDSYFFRDVENRTEGSPDFYWYSSYAAIAAANHALETIANVPNPQDYSAQKGEALVARAYAHFMLVSLFSKIYDPNTAASDPGIPYVITPEKVVFGQYERRTVAYVYEQIEKDLLEGLPLINNTSYRVPKYHFTTAAAHAFATRFYLFKQDYAKVVEHANQVFPGGSIGPNLRPWVSVYSNLTYREGSAIYTQASENANLLLVEAPSLWARNYPIYRYGLSNNIANYFFRSPNVTGDVWSYPLYIQGTDNIFILKFREHFVRTDVNADIGQPYTIFPLFTAEEVLFNRAEANLALNNIEATRADLNLYASTRIADYDARTHGITNAKINGFYNTGGNIRQGLLFTILDFKAAEFVHQGMRWFDLLRHKLPVTHYTFTGQVVAELGSNDPRRVLQLPQEVTLAGLERNPR